MSMDPFRPPDDLDFDNPYAAPKSSFEREKVVPQTELTIPCSIDAIVSASWSIFQNNIGTCLGIVWAMVLIDLGLRVVSFVVITGLQVAMPGEERAIAILNLGMALVLGVIQLWLGIGMNLALLRVARGQPVSFDILFSGGRYLLKSVLGWIIVLVLVVVMVAAPLLLAGAIAAVLREQSGVVVAVMISAVVGIMVLMLYLIARLWQFYFLVMDRDAGVIESINLSWQMTRGHAGTIILVYLSQAVFVLVGALMFCVGLIVAVPFSSMLLAVTYLSLVGSPKGAEHPPVRTWFTNWEEEL
jgi:hypothetical protein